ncbi:hypothetical protein OAK12_01710 [Alphaproteobacteria bacterium]|nr:hypothetical protein [Alphaproteobacteria bacterium]
MFFLKKFIFLTVFFISFNVNGNQFNSISPNSLNIAKTNEIVNFLNNKIFEGIYHDNSKFIETFKRNGIFEFEMLAGEYKGFYRGKWKAENNKVCFLYDGADQYDCSILYFANDSNGNSQVYFGSSDKIFAQITSVNDINTANSLTNNSNQMTTPNAAAPEGTEHISNVDIVTVGSNYLNYPSDNELSELNFDMNKDQVLQVLENNGCKIMTKWKRRVITQGQKDSRDLKSKCFTKKMIVVGFEDNGTMEFIADAHYMGNELSKQFLDNYDKNKARLTIESFQRYSPTLIYNIGSKNAICLNKECLEIVWRDSLRKELAFMYLNPKGSLGKAFANKTIESFKISIERPNDKGCVISEYNPCMIVKAKYVDPSIQYLNMYMNGPRTPERESLRNMYTNYIQAQILAAEALGLVDVASDLKLLLEYIVSDPAQLDMERVTTRISNGTNELFKNTNSGQNNEDAKKKIDEAHIYAARAGGEGALFFNSIAAIFGSSSFEEAAAASEVTSRTKGNLAYFYQALKKIREAKNINLESETQEEFGDAEGIIEIL